MLFVWKVASVVNVASTGLSVPTLGVLDNSDAIQLFDHVTSSSI